MSGSNGTSIAISGTWGAAGQVVPSWGAGGSGLSGITGSGGDIGGVITTGNIKMSCSCGNKCGESKMGPKKGQQYHRYELNLYDLSEEAKNGANSEDRRMLLTIVGSITTSGYATPEDIKEVLWLKHAKALAAWAHLAGKSVLKLIIKETIDLPAK